MFRAAALLALPAVAAGKANILVTGDSWGTDIAGGSVVGMSAFQRKLSEHNCAIKEKNIAIAGSTADDWVAKGQLDTLKKAVVGQDYVWMVLMGNDALAFCPNCALKGKSAAKCGDELIEQITPKMSKILDSIHEASPTTRVVGFGYDIMFGGLGCHDFAAAIFPQCFLTGTAAEKATCFNTQFLRIQGLWETLASNRTWVDTINILGVTQAAAGDAAASVGHPDLAQFAPPKYFRDTLACIHPSLVSVDGKDGSAAMIIMEEFYKQYWSKTLGC